MFNCLYCQKEKRSSNNTLNKYCSNKCQMEHAYNVFIARWINGEEDAGCVNGGVSKYVKRYFIETYGEKCSKCGWNEINPVTKKCPLHLDHIDGNSENNKKENLRLLCPNCHSLTDTFGNLNYGKGRALRRSRYKKVRSS